MTRPNGLQEATALDNFGYYIDPNTQIQRGYLGDCNGVDLANITKNRTVVQTVTSAQLLALFTTPVEIIPAPATGFAIVINRFVARHGTGTAYGGIAAGEDLVLKYTNASGAECSGQMETTGFLDQTTAQIRSVLGVAVAPVDAAAVVLHLLSGNITTGDFDLEVLVDYDVIPTDFVGA